MVAWKPRRHRLGGVSSGRRWSGPYGPLDRTDPTAHGRGRSNAEPTACRSGMVETTPPVRKARERGMRRRTTLGGGCLAGSACRAEVSRWELRPKEAEAACPPQPGQRQQSGRETLLHMAGAAVLSGMLTHTTAGKAVLGPWLPCPRGRSLRRC